MSTLSVKTFAACTNADVADAVLTLAAPLFAACGDDAAMKRLLVSLAVTGWNLSLFAAPPQGGYRAQVEKRLPAELSEGKKEVFTRFVLQLITAKQESYPAMLKGIQTWEFDPEGENGRLTVTTLPVKPV